MPIIIPEAITILLNYKFCVEILSSAVLLACGGGQQTADIMITPSSINYTAKMAKMVSDMEKSETSQYEEFVNCESLEPVEEISFEEDYRSCFQEGFDSSFKAYMDYRCITDISSVQYALQQQAYTDERGFRRIGDDYCVALGTGLTDGCGERFLISLDSGYSFTAIVSDIKADIHTDSTNCYAPCGENAGNIVEFIIDTDYADDYMLAWGSADCFEDLSGNVISVNPI